MDRVHPLDYRVITEFLETLDCSSSLMVAILYRYREFDQITSLSFDPLRYNDLESARRSLQSIELLRKHENLPTSFDKKARALAGFYEAEEVCAESNSRLFARNGHAPEIFSAMRKTADILSDFDVDEFLEFAGWGPGSTVFIKRRDASVANKFRQDAELTPALLRLISPWFKSQFPNWDPNYRVIRSNKVITVPKNAKIDRTIAVEPSLNLYFQKGIGTMIRRRLHRFGVDLNDQGRNQKLCAIGSASGALSTVDFSAASDTICYALVHELLPPKWFAVLDALRSPTGNVSGDLIEYEKFSSMGNGFTFELESLIFYVLALSVVPEEHPLRSSVSVYGDDVIIPSDCYQKYMDLCKYCGFTVNDKKSYRESYYRESCGVHSWNGVDITPIYNRRNLLNHEIMRFHNRVGELSRRTIGFGFRDKRFRSCMAILSDAGKKFNFPAIPDGFGDLGFVRSFDEVCPTFCRTYQRGFYFQALITRPVSIVSDDDSFRLSKLYGLMKQDCSTSDVSLGNKETLSRQGVYRRKRLWTPDWSAFGPWI